MNRSLVIAAILTAGILVGCAKGGGSVSSQPTTMISGNAASDSTQLVREDLGGGVVEEPTESDRAVVRNAKLEILVDNVEKAEKEVNREIRNLRGYLDNVSSTDLSSSGATLTITARIPVSKFEAGIERFEALGARISKTVSSQDITDQLIDLDARLKTLGAHEQTIRAMLQGQKDMNQVISLRDKLMELRQQIETIAAQRKAQGDAAAMSTISVVLHQRAQIAAAGPDPNWFAESKANASTSAMGVFQSVVSIGLWITFMGPFWLPVAIVAWLLWRSRRRTQGAPSSTMA